MEPIEKSEALRAVIARLPMVEFTPGSNFRELFEICYEKYTLDNSRSFMFYWLDVEVMLIAGGKIDLTVWR